MASSIIPAELLQPFTNKINRLAKSSNHAYWYVRRAEEYLKGTSLRPVSAHTKAEVTAWLAELGRNTALSPWQFRQCVEAVGVLMKVAGAPAIKEVDWRYWLDGTRELEPTDATIGRENTGINIQVVPSVAVAEFASSEIKPAFITALRRNGLAYKTEQRYGDWVSRFLTFCAKWALSAKSAIDVRAFLDYLVLERNVSASTQNQALNALVFLFRHVYGTELGELGEFTHSKRPRRLPVVLTCQEVTVLLQRLEGRNGLMASLLYGTGMRLMECLHQELPYLRGPLLIVLLMGLRQLAQVMGIAPVYYTQVAFECC